MRDGNGQCSDEDVSETDQHLLVLCARFQAAHDDWLSCVAAGAGERGEDASEALFSRRADWTRDLQLIRLCQARSPAGIQAKLTVLHALQTWRDAQDVSLLQMREELRREREQLGRLSVTAPVLPSAEKWILGPPPEPIRSWLNMFGASWSRRQPPDRRVHARRTGSQD